MTLHEGIVDPSGTAIPVDFPSQRERLEFDLLLHCFQVVLCLRRSVLPSAQISLERCLSAVASEMDLEGQRLHGPTAVQFAPLLEEAEEAFGFHLSQSSRETILGFGV